MKYTAIKIDMDYCADPVWVSEDGKSFANGSLSEFEDVLSQGLLFGLKVYQQLWENYHTVLSWTGEDLIGEVLEEMQIQLAVRLKDELPNVRVFYSRYDLLDRWVLVEISNNNLKGIYPTMVG